LPVLNDDPFHCGTRLKSSSSLITARDASINAVSPSKAPAAEPYRPSVKIPKRS
jgi:hypothetical protein